MALTPTLAEGQSYVAGRSEEQARELLALAEAAGLPYQVFTTSHGYIVPTAILEHDAADADADADGDDKTSDPAAGDETGTDGGKEFDPVGATIDEVKDYLDGADDTERERVLAAEKASAKPRKGVLELAIAPEGAK